MLSNSNLGQEVEHENFSQKIPYIISFFIQLYQPKLYTYLHFSPLDELSFLPLCQCLLDPPMLRLTLTLVFTIFCQYKPLVYREKATFNGSQPSSLTSQPPTLSNQAPILSSQSPILSSNTSSSTSSMGGNLVIPAGG